MCTMASQSYRHLASTPGVFALMDMVEERDRNLIHACLPAYTRGVAKQLFNEYESKHKFTGRV
jgi:hypothetical protein